MVSPKTILISVDVEGIPLSNGTVDYSSIVKGVPILLKLLQDFGMRFTFFVTGDALVKNIGDLGNSVDAEVTQEEKD